MNYRLLRCPNDSDIPYILSIYRLPSVSQFISIDEVNYWQYVTSAENVWFYKIFDDHHLAATIHLELSACIMYMSIVVFPEHQNKKIGTKILNNITSGRLGIDCKKIQVSIDKSNLVSIKLFEAAGFRCIGEEDKLLEYEYITN